MLNEVPEVTQFANGRSETEVRVLTPIPNSLFPRALPRQAANTFIPPNNTEYLLPGLPAKEVTNLPVTI